MPLETATLEQDPMVPPLSWNCAVPPSPGIVAVKVTLSPALIVYDEESMPNDVGSDAEDWVEPVTVCVIGPAVPTPFVESRE